MTNRGPGTPRSGSLPAVLVAAVALLAVAFAAAPARAADVHGDDDRDVYVGTGGLILPGSVSAKPRREAAGCPGCQWRVTEVCQDPGLGSAFSGRGGCGGLVPGCRDGLTMRRVLFHPTQGPWRDLGLICLGEPLTVAEVGHDVRTAVEEQVPVLAPAFWPARGAVTQLPVTFSSGQPAGSREWSMQVSGRTVRVRAMPSWSWTFGDGAAWTGTDPGGGPSRPTVAHAYGRPGLMPVEVVVRWSATYEVDGLGPFDVPEPVSQSARMEVLVGEGRAVLIPR